MTLINELAAIYYIFKKCIFNLLEPILFIFEKRSTDESYKAIIYLGLQVQSFLLFYIIYPFISAQDIFACTGSFLKIPSFLLKALKVGIFKAPCTEL